VKQDFKLILLKPQVFDCHIHCVCKTTAMTTNDEGGVIQY